MVLTGLTVAVVALLGYGLCSFWTLSQLNRNLDEWIGRHVADGWSVSLGEIKPALFFDHVSLKVPNPKISTPYFEWKGDLLSVSQYFFDPGHAKLVLTGPNHVAFAGNELDIIASPIRIEMRLSGSGGALKALHATANDLQAIASDKSALFAQALGLSLTALNDGAPYTKPWAQILATGAGLTYKSSPEAPPNQIAVAEFSGAVMGAPSSRSLIAALTQWSTAGGTIEVDRFKLGWPTIKVEGDGTIAFDHLLQPIAAFGAHIQGFPSLVEMLENNASLNKSDEETLKQSIHGQVSPSIPITFQNGKVWLGPIAIADQPQIHWPEQQ